MGRYELLLDRTAGTLRVPVHPTADSSKPAEQHRTVALKDCMAVQIMPEGHSMAGNGERQLFLVLHSGERIPIVGYSRNDMFSFMSVEATRRLAAWLNEKFCLPANQLDLMPKPQAG